MQALQGGHGPFIMVIATLVGCGLGLTAGIAGSLIRSRPSEPEAAYCEEMRDPEGEAIYDRAQQRAAATAASAASGQ